MISGVTFRPLRVVSNERGQVREFVRSDDFDFPGFGQVHAVLTLPGIRRAWFRHHHQIDQIAPLVADTRVVLFDDRPDSPTQGVLMDIVMKAAQPEIICIPALVWHGFTPIGNDTTITLQHNSRPFCHAEPDEDKRDADDPMFPIKW